MKFDVLGCSVTYRRYGVSALVEQFPARLDDVVLARAINAFNGSPPRVRPLLIQHWWDFEGYDLDVYPSPERFWLLDGQELLSVAAWSRLSELPALEITLEGWMQLHDHFGYGCEEAEVIRGFFAHVPDQFRAVDLQHMPAARGLDAPPVTERAGVVQVPSGTDDGFIF